MLMSETSQCTCRFGRVVVCRPNLRYVIMLANKRSGWTEEIICGLKATSGGPWGHPATREEAEHKIRKDTVLFCVTGWRRRSNHCGLHHAGLGGHRDLRLSDLK